MADLIESPDHPFHGIFEKLKRANENIVNLDGEILSFFQKCKYPVIPDAKDKEWEDALNYHRSLQVPKRFSVLTGEIIHHLRSCLDHIVWHFSSPAARRDHENVLEFPIFRDPLTKKEQPRYNRKVQGIVKPRVLALVEQLQPYHRGLDAIDDSLCIIHDMDRFDKHRELLIVTACANIVFPAGSSMAGVISAIAYREGKTLSAVELDAAQRAIKNDAKIHPQVAFAKFGNREDQLVVPSVAKLSHAICDVLDLFLGEI
jgi:hypothetical protein